MKRFNCGVMLQKDANRIASGDPDQTALLGGIFKLICKFEQF